MTNPFNRFRLSEKAPLLNYFVKKVLLLLVIYSLYRVVFLGYNWSLFETYPAGALFTAFLHGVRFDISAVFLLSVPACLAALVLPAKDVSFKIVNWLLLLTHVFCLFTNAADTEYYNFTGTRLNLEIFNLAADAGGQALQLIVNYLPLALFGLAANVVLFFLPRAPWSYKKLPSNQWFSWSRIGWRIIFGFVSIVVMVIGIRGGLQVKVLKPIHAFSSGIPELGILTLNSSFTLLQDRKQKQLERKGFFKTSEELKASLGEFKTSDKNYPKQNVVLFILESFSTEFWGAANQGQGFTPFLDTLANSKNAAFFVNNYANGRRSIDALPAILLGFPNLSKETLAKSNFYSNSWYGLGRLLGEKGYDSAFFHAAEKGSMYFDAIAKLAGIKRYYGLEDYPDRERDYDGHWGIFDEPYLQYASGEIDNFEKPFLTVLFTLSSHNPYPLPKEYKYKFKGGDLEIHKNIEYTDMSLSKFFAANKDKEWFKNTLFVFTGDHTEKSSRKEYQSPTGYYRVPLLLYHPSIEFSEVNTSKITQHADILPTVMDFLGFKKYPRNHFGRSTLSSSRGQAVFFAEDNYWHIKDNLIAHRIGEDTKYFDLGGDSRQKTPLELSSEKESELKRSLEAQIQYFNNGLLDNRLYGEKSVSE